MAASTSTATVTGTGAATQASAKKARILLVDDHPMLRSGLIRLIDQQPDMVCCGEAGSVSEGQMAVAKFKPDLAILDLLLKGGDGLELAKTLKLQFPDLRILILTQYEAPLYAERALRAGALGYVVKDQAADELLTAIRAVLAGEVYLTRALASRLLHTFVGTTSKAPSGGLAQLTDRELHVLQLLGAGMSTRQIAAELKLSFKTVETHRENIKRKLSLRGAAELIHYATQWAQQQILLPPQMFKDALSELPAR
jgi:DNA-binding NarL/FixJ family response regulator